MSYYSVCLVFLSIATCQINAQFVNPGFVNPGPISVISPGFNPGFSSVSVRSTAGSTCRKAIDCQDSQTCRMYYHHQYPAMWPPCEHFGTCFCNQGFVQASNGTCMPYINLRLGDRCVNQAWEIIQTPIMRCEGSRVVCNRPTYIESNGACGLAPVVTAAPRPVFFQPTFRAPAPVFVAAPRVVCETVGWLARECDSTRRCCDTSRGLSCQTRGPGREYGQCLCANKHYVFDSQNGYCRPRVYSDPCTEDEDCNSGLISNVGFECRFGRCRCQRGFEPVDNQFWNETSRTTYTLRICVSSSQESTTWVPTGQQCTINPHRSAETARVCHPRAFCHVCRQGYTGPTNVVSNTRTNLGSVSVGPVGAVVDDTAVATGTGICREFTCNNDAQCGDQGSCNRFGSFVNPPCDRGVCDCQYGNGFYKDRFSRCAPRRKLWLGDRCMSGQRSLMDWYPNNEQWDADKECVHMDKEGGYAGFTWGLIKCKLPLIEDKDGNCVRNDDRQLVFFRIVGYNDACHDEDTRLPRLLCDASAGLVCRQRRCTCASTAACGSGYAGCRQTSTSANLIWDGRQCRVRSYGDRCQNHNDCCGGSCNQGVCGCPANTRALQVGSTDIENGVDSRLAGAAVTSSPFCFTNASLVGLGGECHLDPIAWNCGSSRQYGWNPRNFLNPLVCQQGLVCLRCPADYNTDDETHGICRSVTPMQLPEGSCGRQQLSQLAAANPGAGSDIMNRALRCDSWRCAANVAMVTLLLPLCKLLVFV